jgi:hypothetical protein
VNRLTDILLLVLIVAVVGLGVVVWRADVHARDASERDLCIARADATATIALLAPAETVDEEGRVSAMKVLGETIDDC